MKHRKPYVGIQKVQSATLENIVGVNIQIKWKTSIKFKQQKNHLKLFKDFFDIMEHFKAKLEFLKNKN